MVYTKEDVGDVPGKPPLSDARKQEIADEWNLKNLARLRRDLREAFIDEAVSRIATEVPAWNIYERIEIIASVWNLFGNTPTASQTLAKDTYLYVRDVALPKLAGLDGVELAAIDVAGAKPFSAVDPADAGWPI